MGNSVCNRILLSIEKNVVIINFYNRKWGRAWTIIDLNTTGELMILKKHISNLKARAVLSSAIEHLKWAWSESKCVINIKYTLKCEHLLLKKIIYIISINFVLISYWIDNIFDGCVK